MPLGRIVANIREYCSLEPIILVAAKVIGMLGEEIIITENL